MQLYSYNGNDPQPLPFRVTMPDGTVRTDAENQLTIIELNSAGWYYATVIDNVTADWYQTKTYDAPSFDGSTYTFTYILTDLPLEDVKAIKRDIIETERINFLNGIYNEENATVRFAELYDSFGELIDLLATQQNIKNAVSGDANMQSISQTAATARTGLSNYDQQLASIDAATTVAEVVAI